MKLFYAFMIASLIVSSCGNQPKKAVAQEVNEPAALLFDPADLPEEPLFDIETSCGTIRVKLHKETPLHRDNFVQLCALGYYNGIIFHRVIKGFMIQAGETGSEPTAIQMEMGVTTGVDYTIPAEIVPGLTHKRGALAAARLGNPVNPERRSSGSQFFIVHDGASTPHLDGEYTIFGEVVEGFEVIDTIADAPVEFDRPESEIKIVSVTPVR